MKPRNGNLHTTTGGVGLASIHVHPRECFLDYHSTDNTTLVKVAAAGYEKKASLRITIGATAEHSPEGARVVSLEGARVVSPEGARVVGVGAVGLAEHFEHGLALLAPPPVAQSTVKGLDAISAVSALWNIPPA